MINMKIEVMHVLCVLKIYSHYLRALVLGPEFEEINDFKVNIPWQNNSSLFSFCVVAEGL